MTGLLFLQILRHSLDGGVQTLAGFDADHQQIQGIGKRLPNFFLAGTYQAVQDKIRENISQREKGDGNPHQQASLGGVAPQEE